MVCAAAQDYVMSGPHMPWLTGEHSRPVGNPAWCVAPQLAHRTQTSWRNLYPGVWVQDLLNH